MGCSSFMEIPKDIQFGLLERKVGPSVVERIKKNVKEKFSELNVIRKDNEKNNQILCFGWGNHKPGDENYLFLVNNSKNGEIIEEIYNSVEDRKSNMPLWAGISLYTLSIIGIPFLPHYIYDSLSPSGQKKRNERYDLCEKLKQKNNSEIKELIKPIEVYLESPKELSERLGKDVKVIKIGESEKFLHSPKLKFLKARAALLGANAIAKYIEKSKEKNYRYWDYDYKDWKSSSYKIHKHLGIPIIINK
jgi:hypothetical protein